MRRGVAVRAAFVALLLATPALADPPDSAAAPKSSNARAAAEALFQEGLRLYEAGDFASACQRLEASEALDVAVGTLLHLADCYEQVGRTASAWARFREARSLAETQGMTARERIAAERADALEPKLTRLTIRAKHAPTQLEIALDGLTVPRASWGSAMPVDPGWLVLEAKAPGYVTMRKHIHVPARPGVTIAFELPPLALEAPALEAPKPQSAAPLPPMAAVVGRTRSRAVDERSDPGSAARSAGIGLMLIGGAGLGGGGVLALLAGRRHQDSMQYCPEDPRRCTERGVELRSKATRFADYATASVAVGGVLAASGLVIYALAPSGDRRESVALLASPGFKAQAWTIKARGAF